jgi:adenylylsulfate kinase
MCSGPATWRSRTITSCSAEVCRARDPKRLYGRTAAGVIRNLSGVDVSYEAPERLEAMVDTDKQTPEEAAETVLASLRFFDSAAIPIA